MRIDAPLALAVLLASAGSAVAQRYEASRLNGGEPVIDRESFTALGEQLAPLGRNINGPSAIRVPEWIDRAERPDPNANYYLYFAAHRGRFIRMAWASEIDGPYTLFGLRTGSNDRPRGVLDLGPDASLSLGNGLSITGHIASPDVHVDHEAQRIRMYFHAPTRHQDSGIGQKSFVAHSETGLNFNDGIVPVVLGFAYFRVFDHEGEKYAIASRGALYKAPDQPFTPPSGFSYGQELWVLEGEGYNDNPFQHDINDAPGGPERVRHSAVRVTADALEVFHSRVGDRPERILLTTIDLQAGDPTRWDPGYPPEDILRPELPWEGADLPLEASRGGLATNVHQLRDPCVFEGAGGSLYLFYTGAGEEGIGIARLTRLEEE